MRRRSGLRPAAIWRRLRSSGGPAGPSDRPTPDPGTEAPPPGWSGHGRPSNTWEVRGQTGVNWFWLGAAVFVKLVLLSGHRSSFSVGIVDPLLYRLRQHRSMSAGERTPSPHMTITWHRLHRALLMQRVPVSLMNIASLTADLRGTGKPKAASDFEAVWLDSDGSMTSRELEFLPDRTNTKSAPFAVAMGTPEAEPEPARCHVSSAGGSDMGPSRAQRFQGRNQNGVKRSSRWSGLPVQAAGLPLLQQQVQELKAASADNTENNQPGNKAAPGNIKKRKQKK